MVPLVDSACYTRIGCGRCDRLVERTDDIRIFQYVRPAALCRSLCCLGSRTCLTVTVGIRINYCNTFDNLRLQERL